MNSNPKEYNLHRQNFSLCGVSMLSFMAVDWARENKGAGGREGGVIKM